MVIQIKNIVDKLELINIEDVKEGLILTFDGGNCRHRRLLTQFLHSRAKDHRKEKLGTTKVLVYKSGKEKQILGYITLCNAHLEIEKNLGEKGLEKFKREHSISYKYKCYPAIRIGRLCSHKDCQKDNPERKFAGVGDMLIKMAIGIGRKVNQDTGTRFLIVDSKSIAIDFYKKYDFQIFNPEEEKNRRPDEGLFMFFDLGKDDE